MTAAPARTTYVLIDGENIDATLGQVFGRRPAPQERPRWDRLLEFAETRWGQPAVGLFFLAVNGELPMGFVQALMAMGSVPCRWPASTRRSWTSRSSAPWSSSATVRPT